ncbi:Pentatricopeptide repeat (PPR) superfamily protein [Thalictrum thalictroides]|uniref:Pentatricopeptide repeat (PPR) superfamily protein n=1 Tax=Thalictrum thalictroides TaxID=46969 RepID=A0A7J6V5P2_THATH|nr:Pentatricopeptide repeat (PPR) superfamily protein [Thalictrum thalictroides]
MGESLLSLEVYRKMVGEGMELDGVVMCIRQWPQYTVFNRMQERDVISWSTLNGSVSIYLELFECMCADRVKPNDVTFLGVLSACAHAGMVDKARAFFAMIGLLGSG